MSTIEINEQISVVEVDGDCFVEVTDTSSVTEFSSVGIQGPAGPQGPEAEVIASGFIDYNNTLADTPLLADTWTDIPNDGAGAFTNLNFLPPGVTQLMDTNTGYLDLSQLDLGDSVIIRNDFIVTPNQNRANLNFRYELGGGVGVYTLDYFVGRLDSGAGLQYRYNLYTHLIYLGDDNTRSNNIKLQLNLSRNGSFTNNGTAIQILKR